MTARVADLYRYPIKGFSAEPLDRLDLVAGAGVPRDRIWAVEDGPSGFDPAAPAHISKMKFAVLAKVPAVASIRTRLDDASGTLSAKAEGHPHFAGDLRLDPDRSTFAAWLAGVLGGSVSGALRVIEGPGQHRFTDHPGGHVSLINLNSVRDLASRMGGIIDPMRFRANIYVDGWPAWTELDYGGVVLQVGGSQLRGLVPIVRCAATEVDPQTAERDLPLVEGLFKAFGHRFCGLYAQVEQDGRVQRGDRLERRS